MEERILITGGAGFIGSHLVEACLAAGHSVCVIDDLSTGSLDNLGHLRDHPRLQCVVGSVTDRRLVCQLVRDTSFVFHMAAAVGVQLIIEQPVHTICTNLAGTEVVLEACSNNAVPVLVASTSEVYGKSPTLPFREDQDLVLGATSRARWAYACSKAADEFMALAYHREHELPTVVVRLFNTVGPRQTGRYGMVLPRFIDQARSGEPLTVYGDGQQRRCFAHVEEVVRCLMALKDTPSANGEVVNIGTQNEISILELAERVRGVLGSQSEILFVPYEEAYQKGFEDMRRRIPDLSKLRGLVGFAPERNIDEIIHSLVEAPRSQRISSLLGHRAASLL